MRPLVGTCTLGVQVLSRGKLQDLVREVDPNEQLDEEVEELLLQIADDFIESTVNASCLLAKHRQAAALDVTDVQMHLGKHSEWIFAYDKTIQSQSVKSIF